MTISRVSEMEAPTDGEPGLRVVVGSPVYGGATILVVDDDPLVRAFTSEVLRLEGFFVLEAAGTAEGLQTAAEHRGRIDLLISDVVMPHGDGCRDLVEGLGEMRPTTKLLYISGHPEVNVARSGASLSAAFLQKPFTVDMLVEKVRTVLDAEEVRIARA